MFDLGFGELLLIAVVALVVLGPERLPKAARFAGLWVRRARAQWYSVKSELERELAAEELKRSIDETREAAGDLRDRVRASGDEVRRDFERMRGEVSDAIEPWAPAASPAPAPAVDAPAPADAAAEPGATSDDAPSGPGDTHVRGDR
ncbi:Sec-independent protein translocase protein TatB [Luteimonas sp. MC1828]|uniref:Sec-independent protein translocase protein TatB n=1 Tax=Luteimonas sp. MC1828 TaxID=2799787 RepID=UPI0018F2724D|nr:Sec-independent protein translocase protein TatB [Luteimonas sp. MC1828]MBJ7575597.1 twin-arginine translocase subunit TatB [Luteimonas sp. MC1828]